MAQPPGYYPIPTGVEFWQQATVQNSVTVPFTELGPREGGSPIIAIDGEGGGSKCERMFKVKWSDIQTFTRQTLGFSYVTLSSGGTTAKLHRYMPMFDPYFPWLPATRISRIQGMNWLGTAFRPPAGWQSNQDVLYYDNGIVTVEFNEVNYAILSDGALPSTGGLPGAEFYRYVTFTTDTSVDYLSIPSGSGSLLQFLTGSNAGQVVPEPPGKTIPGQCFHYRWRRVPYQNVPWQVISDTMGKVNKTTFSNCPPESLLLTAKDQELVKQVDGSWTVDLIYTMRYLGTQINTSGTLTPGGWNAVYDWLGTVPGYQQVGISGTTTTLGAATDGKKIFDAREFGSLFEVVPAPT